MYRFTPLMALAVAVAGLFLPVKQAKAAPDAPPVQAPGFYKWKLGDLTITSLSDGTFDMPVDRFIRGPKPGELDAALKAAFTKLPMEMSVNAFLIDTGSQRILVDAGGGRMYGPSLGKVRANLVAAGYQPERIDLVLLTHIHGDHSAGLLVDGAPAFPAAKVVVGEGDIEHFVNPTRKNAADSLSRTNFEAAEAVLSAYQASGQLQLLAGNAAITPNVRAVAARGHSPGHTVYVVESQGHQLMLLGDLIHVPEIQFAKPHYTMDFDVDRQRAKVSRKDLLRTAAQQRHWIAGSHLPFPGIGHIRAVGDGFVFVPAEYSANR